MQAETAFCCMNGILASGAKPNQSICQAGFQTLAGVQVCLQPLDSFGGGGACCTFGADVLAIEKATKTANTKIEL